jgi:K+-sensing histidine kinase KdpD
VSQLGMGLADEVSNDLRQPITVIKGCVETVLSRWDDLEPSQRRELLAAALQGADHLVVSLEALEARLEAVDQAMGSAPGDASGRDARRPPPA